MLCWMAPGPINGQRGFEKVGKTGIGRIARQLSVLYTVRHPAIAYIRERSGTALKIPMGNVLVAVTTLHG